MAINRARVRELLQTFDFKTLFIEEIGWSNPPRANTRPQSLNIDGVHCHYQMIAQMSGVGVFEVYPADGHAKEQLQDRKVRNQVHKQIEKLAYENLIIFLDDDKERTQSIWYWMKREGKKAYPREHLYLKGQPQDLFLSKLDGLIIELDELRPDGTVPLSDVTHRLANSLDIERVTKKFFTEFSELRVQFIDLIEGIDREADRFWYASVLLNRLMFIYFLQKRGFIQNNTRYLDQKLADSKARGEDRYYQEFLNKLFFEGFAKPADKRSPEAKTLLGDIKYLNGGLFLPHQLELNYTNIHIPDQAFENVLTLFGSYSWHLDDSEGATENEINPDVLGYIFEKYINQKAFGAYYTRPEITEYLCERTIHSVILEHVHKNSQYHFNDFNQMMMRLDADLCRLLLFTVLPKLSILDPACGSGAFLVAAMKTLLNVYAPIFGKIKFLSDTSLTQHLKEIERNHPSINYYIRKQIITDNLYGVDIMDEAVEIAKLRLFLVLVSSAQTVDQLEPLPNIDFNIMAGNSLIGLLEVQEHNFKNHADDDGKVQPLLFTDTYSQYTKLLEEKNRLVTSYRNASNLIDDLQALRQKIDEHKANAYTKLNDILLTEFQDLGVKFEQAQPIGKGKKRPLKLADIERLEPFHWGYEFDEIMARGGFDVIIANPPWEIFKPQSKEFFARYSDLVTKNKMTIKDFEKQQKTLLQDDEIQSAWLEYQSSFPYVSEYYRATPQYRNQISVVNNKKQGTDINLYKLFTEQCLNLLRKGGQMGIVIPSGIYTDLGTKQLREMLFSQTTVTGLFGFENRKLIFEGVDSRFKFVVLTLEKDGTTTAFPASFMRHDVSELNRFPAPNSLMMQVDTIRKMSPDSLSIPEYKQPMDLQIADKMSRFPLLGETLDGVWNIRLKNEFHMRNDSDLFHTEEQKGYLPLFTGKMFHQFELTDYHSGYWINEDKGRKRLIGQREKDTGQQLDYQSYRWVHRRIASNTNERTFITTLCPPYVFTEVNSTTLSIIDSGINYSEMISFSAVCNSFVLDYLLRQRVTTTLNMFYIYQLPVPRLQKGDRFFDAIVERAAKLICTTPEYDDLAREVGLGSHASGVTDAVGRARLRADLDGMVAHIYGLTEEEFAYVLGTFPLVGEPVKLAALNAYRDVERGVIG